MPHCLRFWMILDTIEWNHLCDVTHLIVIAGLLATPSHCPMTMLHSKTSTPLELVVIEASLCTSEEKVPRPSQFIPATVLRRVTDIGCVLMC